MRVTKYKKIALVITLSLAAVTLAAYILKQNAGCLSDRDYYVYDGDTIELDDHGKIRYIGIDCPERNEPYYKEAKEYNEVLLSRGKIQLEFDSESRDRYGRVLAYVFVVTDNGERIFVNEELTRAGWATTKYVKPYMRYADVLFEAEDHAQDNELGIWENR